MLHVELDLKSPKWCHVTNLISSLSVAIAHVTFKSSLLNTYGSFLQVEPYSIVLLLIIMKFTQITVF